VRTCFTFAITREDRVIDNRCMFKRRNHVPATLIPRGPTRRFALKLTTLRKNARTPLRNNQMRPFAPEGPRTEVAVAGLKRWE
jgi:hypothetical protein